MPERAHNFLLHRFPEGAEKEQSLMQEQSLWWVLCMVTWG